MHMLHEYAAGSAPHTPRVARADVASMRASPVERERLCFGRAGETGSGCATSKISECMGRCVSVLRECTQPASYIAMRRTAQGSWRRVRGRGRRRIEDGHRNHKCVVLPDARKAGGHAREDLRPEDRVCQCHISFQRTAPPVAGTALYFFRAVLK